MRLPGQVFALTAILLASAPALAGADSRTASLSTAQTHVRLWAGEDGVVLEGFGSKTKPNSWSAKPGTELKLIDRADVNGNWIALKWKFVGQTQSTSMAGCEFEFTCVNFPLEGRSFWRSEGGTGPIRHTLSIRNLSKQSIRLPLQSSLSWRFSRDTHGTLKCWWVEKGAGGPSRQGVHQEVIGSEFHQVVLSRPYVDDKTAYAEDGAMRDNIPWLAVHDEKANSGWYAGVEFSGRVSLSLDSLPSGRVNAELGLAKEDAGNPPFIAEVQAGETYTLPTVFLGCFNGSVDEGANEMKQWLSAHLHPKEEDPKYPLLTLNSWGSGFAVDAKLANSMMDNAANLGLEMFHIDAGWFPGIGDWRPDAKKFPDGIGVVADRAHKLGLKFGLWVGWTQGGIMPSAEDPPAVLNVHDAPRTSWFSADYPAAWKPSDFTGADLCLADPQASDWCIALLDRLVPDFHLDMLEHDQRMVVDTCIRADHGHSVSHGDVAYRAAQGYYRVYDAVRKNHPQLLFENCVNGGRMVDFGALQRADYFSITDSYFPIANRRAFYDVSYAIPPAMCECYINAQPNKSLDEFRSMLRSGMMGWCTIMQDPAAWTAEEKDAARRQFTLYKTKLRPLILHGNLYHVSDRPDGVRWDGIQYATRDGEAAVLYAFRGSTTATNHVFRFQGLRPDSEYTVRFEDGGLPEKRILGRELMTSGLSVQLASRGTSQLVFVNSR